MANANRGRRGRPRKRRPARAGTPKAQAAREASAPLAPSGAERLLDERESPALDDGPARPSPRRRSRSRSRGAPPRPGSLLTDRLAVGERPRAPWHPLPLSELLILVGAIGVLVGLSRGESGLAVLIAGLAAVLIGTVEVTLREHLSGYRSQTLILTLLPTILLFTGVVLLTRPPRAVILVLLVLDLALGVFLFRWLRGRFLRARRERTFATGR